VIGEFPHKGRMRTDQRFEEIAGSDFNIAQGAMARRV
jgi:hypothetical protein